MPNDQYDIFDDEEEISEADLPKKLRAKIKELTAKVGELSDENSSLKGEQRSRTLSEALSSRGLNPKIATFIPKDLEDEKIDEWLGEYAELFGGGQPVDPQQAVITRDAEQAAAIRQFAKTETGSTDPNFQGVLANIENAANMDELMEALRQG